MNVLLSKSASCIYFSCLKFKPHIWCFNCRIGFLLHQSFWNSSDLGGRKSWGPPITSVIPVPVSAKHFWMMCLFFLTEVGNAGHIVNTGTSSVNSEFVTALNTWYFICFWQILLVTVMKINMFEYIVMRKMIFSSEKPPKN